MPSSLCFSSDPTPWAALAPVCSLCTAQAPVPRVRPSSSRMFSRLTCSVSDFPLQAALLCCSPSYPGRHCLALHSTLILRGAVLLLGSVFPRWGGALKKALIMSRSESPCLFYPTLRDSLFIFLGSNTPCRATKALLPSTLGVYMILPHVILGLTYSGGTGKGLYHSFWRIVLLW